MRQWLRSIEWKIDLQDNPTLVKIRNLPPAKRHTAHLESALPQQEVRPWDRSASGIG